MFVRGRTSGWLNMSFVTGVDQVHIQRPRKYAARGTKWESFRIHSFQWQEKQKFHHFNMFCYRISLGVYVFCFIHKGKYDMTENILF